MMSHSPGFICAPKLTPTSVPSGRIASPKKTRMSSGMRFATLNRYGVVEVMAWHPEDACPTTSVPLRTIDVLPLLKVTVAVYVPTARLLAAVFVLMVTIALPPAAMVPLVGDRDSHGTLLVAV